MTQQGHNGGHGPLEIADDRIIAARAADGDTVAFAVLVRRYTQMMRAYARRIMFAPADVEDVVQEAFIAAWEQLPALQDSGKVKSWLMRITGHKAIDRMRASHASAQVGQHVDIAELDVAAAAAQGPSDRAEAREALTQLRAAVGHLPDAQRQCWTLRHIGELSYDEIADELDAPVSTVRGLLARARKTIIVRMEEWR